MVPEEGAGRRSVLGGGEDRPDLGDGDVSPPTAPAGNLLRFEPEFVLETVEVADDEAAA